ncbi:MAG: CysS/YqeB C-terminal domain-containing protein, partial [Actinomycetota bacterium]
SAALYPKATDHIPQMFEIISKLISKGHAYVVGGTVYFDVDSFPGYGKLSRNTLDRLEAGHRLEETDPRKRRHYDFTLWREAGPRRRLKWESPWGEGYPGWHIECSAMSIAYLGETFDLHTGGSDNIFPHHEDEIAQSEGAVGHPVVRHWNHGHHLLAEGRKMAKSAGNYYTVDDLIGRGYDPLAFRLLVMQARYRAQSNFTWEALDAAQRGLERLRRQTAEWASEVPETPSDAGKRLDQEFAEAVADDLDLPAALRVVSKVPSAEVAPGEKSALVRRWDEVLGLDLHREVVSRSELPEGAAEKIAARERARARGDFEAADRLRDELAESGVDLIDTPSGTRWVPRRGVGA